MKATREQLNSIYDEFRTAKLNQEYYSIRMARVRNRLRKIDIFLALFAGGSAIAGFSFWSAEFLGIQIGQATIGFLTAIAVLLGIAKPYFRLDDELERLSSIQGSYESISHLFEDVVRRIEAEHDVDETSKEVYSALRQIRGHLGPKEDKPAVKDLTIEVQKQINKRYPIDRFWHPDD